MALHTVYTSQEYADMPFCYGRADDNSSEDKWLYKEKFAGPNCSVHQQRCILHHNTITALHSKLAHTRSVFTRTKEREAIYQDEMEHAELEESIIYKIQRNPHISVRNLSIQTGAMPSCV